MSDTITISTVTWFIGGCRYQSNTLSKISSMWPSAVWLTNTLMSNTTNHTATWSICQYQYSTFFFISPNMFIIHVLHMYLLCLIFLCIHIYLCTIYKFICMYIYTYMQIFAYIWVYINMYLDTYTYIYLHTYVYICIYSAQILQHENTMTMVCILMIDSLI